MHVVYADVLILINFSMDFLVLFITAKVFRADISVIRLTVASAIGALYSLSEFIIINSAPTLQVFFNIIISYIMCLIAIRSNIVKTIIITGVFYGLCFTVGGAISAIYSLVGSAWQIKSVTSGVYADIPLWQICIFGGSALAIAQLISSFWRGKLDKKTAHVEFTFNGNYYEFEALVDSGCMVKEPITNTDVVFIKKKIDVVLEDCCRICVIPVRTVAGKKLFTGIRIKEFSCNGDNKNVIVVFDSENTFKYGGYEAIIPNSLIM